MLPADTPPGERILWAAISAVLGAIHDGPELADDRRLFLRLETACRSFGVPADAFDDCARSLDFHYYRPWDCYLSRSELAEARELDGVALH